MCFLERFVKSAVSYSTHFTFLGAPFCVATLLKDGGNKATSHTSCQSIVTVMHADNGRSVVSFIQKIVVWAQFLF